MVATLMELMELMKFVKTFKIDNYIDTTRINTKHFIPVQTDARMVWASDGLSKRAPRHISGDKLLTFNNMEVENDHFL